MVHPIHDQTLFLNEMHKKQLKEEFSKNLFYLFSLRELQYYAVMSSMHNLFFADVEPWTFEQYLGEAVFIPAGCPHQVRNRQVNKHPMK